MHWGIHAGMLVPFREVMHYLAIKLQRQFDPSLIIGGRFLRFPRSEKSRCIWPPERAYKTFREICTRQKQLLSIPLSIPQPSKSSQTPTFIWLSHYNIPSYYSLNHRHESIFPYTEKLEHKLWVPNQSDELPNENFRPFEDALPWLEILDNATTQNILSARTSIRSARL